MMHLLHRRVWGYSADPFRIRVRPEPLNSVSLCVLMLHIVGQHMSPISSRSYVVNGYRGDRPRSVISVWDVKCIPAPVHWSDLRNPFCTISCLNKIILSSLNHIVGPIAPCSTCAGPCLLHHRSIPALSWRYVDPESLLGYRDQLLASASKSSLAERNSMKWLWSRHLMHEMFSNSF